MQKILLTSLLGLCLLSLGSCNDNKAAETQPVKKPLEKTNAVSKTKLTAPVKEDGPAIGAIETGTYTLKLHRAFTYAAKGSAVLAGFKPKEGYKFIYLDASLRNTSNETLNGGFLFIALKVTDEKGVEYKKPTAGLAAYTSNHPEDSNNDEYNALWEDFAPNEFHRDIVYCVEVPVGSHSFVLHLPADKKRKEWKTLPFTVN